MKKIFILVAILGAFTAHAQKGSFATADDALFYLEDKFAGTTAIKEGDYWIDPIMLQFEEDDSIYLHTVKGKILSNDYITNNEVEMKKLHGDGMELVTSILWDEIKSITIKQNSLNGWWLTINAPVYNNDNKVIRNITTLYIANGREAGRIKAALDYLRK